MKIDITRNDLVRGLIRNCFIDNLSAFTDNIVVDSKVYYVKFSFRELKNE